MRDPAQAAGQASEPENLWSRSLVPNAAEPGACIAQSKPKLASSSKAHEAAAGQATNASMSVNMPSPVPIDERYWMRTFDELSDFQLARAVPQNLNVREQSWMSSTSGKVKVCVVAT
eukprot:s864_g1.t1